MVENYHEPEDFLSDESFLAWYFKTGTEQEKAWDLWIKANPDRRELVQQAVELLNASMVAEKKLPVHQIRRAEDALMQKIRLSTDIKTFPDLPQNDARETLPVQQTGTLPAAPQTKVITPFRWMAAASIIALLVIGMFLTGVFRPRKPEIKTQYGQISQLNLPDGTAVTMNANTKLTYSSGWKDGTDREVWVNGEAFFHVTKTPLKSRFIVHTDHFDVIVTGTQFNVVNRHDKSNVMLKEGSVTIDTRDGKTLHMAPGDFVEFNKNSNQVANMPVKDDSLLAWKEQKLIFNKTPLADIAAIINEQYGVPVKLAVECPYTHTVTGIMRNNNLDVLLQALEATSEFYVIRKAGNDTITIQAHCLPN